MYYEEQAIDGFKADSMPDQKLSRNGKVRAIDPKTGEYLSEIPEIPSKLTVNHFFLNNKRIIGSMIELQVLRDKWKEYGINSFTEVDIEDARALIQEYRSMITAGNVKASIGKEENRVDISNREHRAMKVKLIKNRVKDSARS